MIPEQPPLLIGVDLSTGPDESRYVEFEFRNGVFEIINSGRLIEGECMNDNEARILALLARFGNAFRDKLLAAEVKHGWNSAWLRSDWREQLLQDMHEHIAKGDPLDVAAYCAFAWHHGYKLAPFHATNAKQHEILRDSIGQVLHDEFLALREDAEEYSHVFDVFNADTIDAIANKVLTVIPDAHVWQCGAAASTPLPGSEPQDCNYPLCGCDPNATRVVDALREAGYTIVEPLE